MLPRIIALTLLATSLLAAEPDKLTKLRGSYESAMTKATAPIQKTYRTELEKLKIDFTRAGNLEAALAVDAELKKLTPAQPSIVEPSDQISDSDERKREKLIKFICDGEWRNLGQTVYGAVFRADGTFSELDAEGALSKNGTWTFKDDSTIGVDASGPGGSINILIPLKNIDQKRKQLTTLKLDGTHRGDWGKK